MRLHEVHGVVLLCFSTALLANGCASENGWYDNREILFDENASSARTERPESFFARMKRPTNIQKDETVFSFGICPFKLCSLQFELTREDGKPSANIISETAEQRGKKAHVKSEGAQANGSSIERTSEEEPSEKEEERHESKLGIKPYKMGVRFIIRFNIPPL